jgi:hypothetical protein
MAHNRVKNQTRTPLATPIAVCSGRQPLNNPKLTIQRIINVIGVLSCIQVFTQIALHLHFGLTTPRIFVLNILSCFFLYFGEIFDVDAFSHFQYGIKRSLPFNLALEAFIFEFDIRLAILQVVVVAISLYAFGSGGVF